MGVVLLHSDKLPYPQRLLFPFELSLGTHVACGNASKIFHPYILVGDLEGSSEELRNKLLVDFDPLECFVGNLEKEFSNKFEIWYDSLGGDDVGLTWGTSGSKKQGREEADEEIKNPIDLLKDVGET